MLYLTAFSKVLPVLLLILLGAFFRRTGFLSEATVAGMKKLVVNFADVQFINTIGLSIFTGMVQKTLDHNSRLCFTNMKKVHRDVFEMVGLIKHVKIFKDEADALIFFKGKE